MIPPRYTLDSVSNSAVENFRVRPVNLHYFLADGTLEVQEPKIKNSGLAHGALVSRQRVVLEDCDADGELVVGNGAGSILKCILRINVERRAR
jgi:hypothetical protein